MLYVRSYWGGVEEVTGGQRSEVGGQESGVTDDLEAKAELRRGS